MSVAVLERPPVDVEEMAGDASGFDEVLAVFPEKLSEMTIEEIIDAREQVVDILVSKGVTTREQIDSGESHAKKAGVSIDNAELLQPGAHEVRNGQVDFSEKVVQQVFDNWQTRIGEATSLAGDNFKVEQKLGEDGTQIETAFGGSIDMMIRGLDMNIALAKKDPRFLSEVQSSLSDVRTEVQMSDLMSKYPDREFVVFQTRPYAHTMLEKAGEDFVKRRHFSGDDEKTAMHFSFKIGSGSRSMMQTVVNGDNLEIWDEVYGDKHSSDVDRLNNLMIVDVTDRNIDHDEIHILSVANIDEVQSRHSGELTHAGVLVGSIEERQALYDIAIDQAKQAEKTAVENAHNLTQLSIEIAESILTGKMSDRIRDGIEDALAARTSSGDYVLGERQRLMFEQVMQSGQLNELAASALQELTILQESARSTASPDRLASLLGADQAAEVVSGKSLEAATLDAFAEGKRAGGCPGADDETLEEVISNIRITDEQRSRKEWLEDIFNEKEIAEIQQAERRVESEYESEQVIANLHQSISQALESGEVAMIRQIFGLEESEDSDSESYQLKIEAIKNTMVYLRLLYADKSDEDNLERTDFTAEQLELTAEILVSRLQHEPLRYPADTDLKAAYEKWLTGLLSADKIDHNDSAIDGAELSKEKIADVNDLMGLVVELIESQSKLENGLADFFEDIYENRLLAAEFSDDPGIIAGILEKLSDSDFRQEFVKNIVDGMKKIDELLEIDLLLEQISPETEILIQEMLQLGDIENHKLFTDEEIKQISASLSEGRLNKDIVVLIRRYSMYKQLESLVADHETRVRMISNPRMMMLIQLSESEDTEGMLAFLTDRLVRSASMPAQLNDRLATKRRIGIFAVAGFRFDRNYPVALSSLNIAEQQPMKGQLVFA